MKSSHPYWICPIVGLFLAVSATAEEPRRFSPPTVGTLAAPASPHGWRQVRSDVIYVARRPFHSGRRGRTKLYATLGATAALYLAREEIRDQVQESRSPGRTELLNDVHTMGQGAFAPTLALAAYLSSFATGNDREKETAVMLLESAALSAATAYTGSFVLAAQRPEDGRSVSLFSTDGRGVSLDAALAASVVTPLRRQYFRVRPDDGAGMRTLKWSATVLLYSGAVLTGFQRMDSDQHWAPDVFLGLSAGFNIGKAICDNHDGKKRARGRLSYTPIPRGAAVAFRWSLNP